MGGVTDCEAPCIRAAVRRGDQCIFTGFEFPAAQRFLAAPMTHVLALPSGTELVGDFRIGRVLGAGGFGITYLADEIALARSVTIKEYFPTDFAARDQDHAAVPRSSDCAGDYRWGLDRFIEEAQTLARFDHRNICRVYRYFRANNTGYMVLHFEEGASLKGWLQGLGRAPRQAEIDRIVGPLLDALEIIHKADFLHRDIAPDNIMIRKDGSPVLIDFGSARGDIARHSRTVSALVKPGYSPYEQYAETGSQQGPWTDIYALGATLYHAITGKRPPDSPSRIVNDDFVRARDAALSTYRPRFLAAIDRALDLDIKRRPQTIAAWRGDLLAPEPEKAKAGWLQRGDAAKADQAALLKANQKLGAVAANLPVPDAPGGRGSILDFFDGLKKKEMPAAAVNLSPPPPPPSVHLRTQVSDLGALARPLTKPLPQRSEPKPPPPVRTPRPRRVSSYGSTKWRRRMAALLVLVGIASAGIGLRDHITSSTLPGSAVKGAGGVNGGKSDARMLAQLKGHAGGTQAVMFTGDGTELVTVGSDASLKVWTVPAGGLVRTISLSNGNAKSLAVQGRQALTAHQDGTVVLWDIDRGERLASFKRNEASIWSIAFAGGPGQFVTAAHDWSVALWDVGNTSAAKFVFEGHENPAQAVAYSGRGPYLASGAADKQVKLWSTETMSLLRTYRGHKDFITSVDFSADGRMLASASMDGGLRVWSTSSSRLVVSLPGHRGRINSVAFAPSGELLATAGDDGSARMWDVRRGRSVASFESTVGGVNAIAFSSDGQRLAAAAADGSVRIWNANIVRASTAESRE